MAAEAVRAGYNAHNAYDAYFSSGKGKIKGGADAEDKGVSGKTAQERMDYQKFLQKKIEELYVKFQNGESEPSYQIGAASFTEKEWDKLLEKFDAVQDTIRTQMREEHAKRATEWEKQAVRRAEIIAAGRNQEQADAVRESAVTVEETAGQQSAAGQQGMEQTATEAAGQQGMEQTAAETAAQQSTVQTVAEAAGQQDAASVRPGQETSLLAGSYTSAVYSPNKPGDEPIHYITCYTQDGIFCRRAGNEGYEWSLRFANREEYDKVIQFVEQFPSDWNMRFASNETFWKDFLDDKIDLERFGEFLEGTDKGVPDYTITVGDSMYIDRDKVQWAKYLNRDIGKFYTAQEMRQMQEELIKRNTAKMHKLTDPYENIYRQIHPEYRGERIFCEYPGGPLYTANEIGKRMYQKYLESKTETI